MAIDKEKPDDLGSSGLNSWRKESSQVPFKTRKEVRPLIFAHQKTHQKKVDTQSKLVWLAEVVFRAPYGAAQPGH